MVCFLQAGAVKVGRDHLPRGLGFGICFLWFGVESLRLTLQEYLHYMYNSSPSLTVLKKEKEKKELRVRGLGFSVEGLRFRV